jgi:hypothetical protein
MLDWSVNFIHYCFISTTTVLSSISINKILPLQKLLNIRSLLFIVSFIFTLPVVADHNSLEYKIKAGYLYNFTKFISWPALQSETFNLCIIGNDPFGTLLNPIEEKLAQGKPMRIIRLPQYQPDQACHIAFFKSAQPHLDKTQNQAPIFLLDLTMAMLTVTNHSDFSELGGMIEFIIVDDKIRLQIDLHKLRASGLEISAKLLEVSQIIGETKQ